MKFSLHGIRRYGRIAAFLAVYALVLNTTLTGTLLASISPVQLNAAHELCLPGGETSATDTGDRTANPIRCPLCLSPAITITLPPDSPTIAVRTALYAPITFAQCDVFIALSESSHQQARGPPAFG